MRAELFRQHNIPDSQKLIKIERRIKQVSQYYFCPKYSMEIINLHREKLQIKNERKKKPLTSEEIEYTIFKTEATRGIVRAQHTRKFALAIGGNEALIDDAKSVLNQSKALDDHAEAIRKSKLKRPSEVRSK